MSFRLTRMRSWMTMLLAVLALCSLQPLSAAPARAATACPVSVAPASGIYAPAQQVALAWWNYSLEGTGISVHVQPLSPQVGVLVQDSAEFAAASPFTSALGYAYPATALGPGLIVLDASAVDAEYAPIVFAHELGHALLADHAYADAPLADPGSVMGAGYSPGLPLAWVNATDRLQVLSHASELAAAYCPGFVPSAPSHALLPERSVEVERTAVIDALVPFRPAASFAAVALADASSKVLATRQGARALASQLAGVQVVSERTLAGLVAQECARGQLAEIACPAKDVSALLLAPRSALQLNDQWLDLHLPSR